MGTISDVSITRSAPAAIQQLPADSSRITEFHCTGFSHFHNVPINPTQLIMESLPAYLSDNPLAKNAVIASAKVLKVSAKTTRAALESMYSSLSTPTHPAIMGRKMSDRKIVFIHFGVNVGASSFELEIQGRNEATFSCPDELGWAPIKRPIDRDNDDLNAVCRTTLPLDSLVGSLKKCGFRVETSTDAGRFVCNWTYYNSLKLALPIGASALFVHVPPADVVSVDEQVRFSAALFNEIACLSAVPAF